MSETEWPSFERAPAVAFVDVDGTLLAETTTFLFARILLRRGLIRRSFLLRALYHGLQHRLGRLDYGRLIAYGLKNISRIPVVELERIAYENFTEYVRPCLYDGVVDHFNGLRRRGTPIVLVSSSPGLVIEPLSLYLGCTATLTTPVVIERNRMIGMGTGPACYDEPAAGVCDCTAPGLAGGRSGSVPLPIAATGTSTSAGGPVRMPTFAKAALALEIGHPEKSGIT